MEHVIARLLQDFEQGKMNRRQLIKTLALAATAASATAPLGIGVGSAEASAAAAPAVPVAKATRLHHVSHPVVDYAKSRDWYMELFGMTPVFDDKRRKADLKVGESLLILKNKVGDEPPADHICFRIAGWDEDKEVRPAVEAEFKRRKVPFDRKTEMSSYYFDPDGFSVQIGGEEQ
jgi:catechol 2,3-dioxygenase-like lactoylglutathione lyase family enzyme